MNFGPGKLYLNGKLRGECSEIVIEVTGEPVAGNIDPGEVVTTVTGNLAMMAAAIGAFGELAQPERRRKRAQWKQRNYGPQRR